MITRTLYDPVDNVTKTIDAMGNVSETIYDADNRPVYEVGPDLDPDPQDVFRAATVKTYDGNGQVLTQQGPFEWDPQNPTPAGRLSGSFYDKQGRVTMTISDLDGDGQLETADDTVTTTEYDLLGNVKIVTDPRNNVTTTDYDKANRATFVSPTPKRTSGTVGAVYQSDQPAWK